MHRFFIAFVLAATLLISPGRGEFMDYEEIFSDLNYPSGITVSNGVVYVAEGGTGGDTCTTVNGQSVCYGTTSSISKCVVSTGRCTRIVTGFPSYELDGGLSYGGINDVVVSNGDLYFITMSAPAISLDSTCPSGYTSAVFGCKHPFGKLYKYKKRSSTKGYPVIADLSAYSISNGGWMTYREWYPYLIDCIAQDVATNPYKIIARSGTFYVSDAAANIILTVNGNTVSTFAVVPPIPMRTQCQPDNDDDQVDRDDNVLNDPVPTGLATKQGSNSIYYTNLGGAATNQAGMSLIHKVSSKGKQSIIPGIAFDTAVDLLWVGNDLYVLTIFNAPFKDIIQAVQSGDPSAFCGSLLLLPNGKAEDAVVLISPPTDDSKCDLFAPAGMAYENGYLYVITGSGGTETGSVLRVDIRNNPVSQDNDDTGGGGM